MYNRSKGYVELAVNHAKDFKIESVRKTSVYVSQRSLRVLKAIASDKRKQIFILLAFFVLAWTLSLSAMRGRSASYNQLKVKRISNVMHELEGVEEACSVSTEGFQDVKSIAKLVCHGSPACGVDHDLSLGECDSYWRKTLQRGHVESIDLPRKGLLDQTLETVDDVISYLEEAIKGDKRLQLSTHMAMGRNALLLPLPWNAKSVIQREGYTTPEGHFVAYRVQGVGGGNTFAYYVDRVLGFNKVLPSSMRLMSTTSLQRLIVQSLRTKARGMRTALLQKKATAAIKSRSTELTKLAAEKFSFNKTHVLVEMVAAIPDQIESNHVQAGSKSPLLDVEDSTYWDFVTMATEGDLPETPQGRNFAKAAMDVVDMQIFDYIVGNDNRRYPSITFLGKDQSFLLVGDNIAAGSGADKTPPIKMPNKFQTPDLYLGAIGCKFRERTINRLNGIKMAGEMNLSRRVRDEIMENDSIYVEHYKALAHGWLMATLKQVDLLTNTDLDENLEAVLDHVQTCVETYGKRRVYVHA